MREKPNKNSIILIEKNNSTRTVRAESSKFASLLFDHGFQIVIPPASVPQPIWTPSDGICINPIVVYYVNCIGIEMTFWNLKLKLQFWTILLC